VPTSFAPPIAIARYQRVGLIVGAVGTVASIIGLVLDRSQFMHSYLVAFLFVLAIPLASLGLLMLQYVTGGAWGFVIRRILEAATRTFPIIFILFIPIAIGVKDLFLWTDPNVVKASASLTAKAPYLNLPFFYVRVVLYFAVWYLLSSLLSKWSASQDKQANPAWSDKAVRLSGPGLLLFALTVTFSAFDWMMSLDPEWYSTIYGLVVMVGQVINAFSFVVVMIVLLAQFEPMRSVILRSHLRDLGKLLFAFVMLWAYFSFSQFLIIWAGNLPDEIPWYLTRTLGGWQILAILLIVAHFALPFLLLLSRDVKSKGKSLIWVAGWLIFMRLVDLYWNIEPAFHRRHFFISWMDLAVPVALGGIVFAFFCWTLSKRPLMPVNDEEFAQSLLPTDHFH
jgi:hypothetical protein